MGAIAPLWPKAPSVRAAMFLGRLLHMQALLFPHWKMGCQTVNNSWFFYLEAHCWQFTLADPGLQQSTGVWTKTFLLLLHHCRGLKYPVGVILDQLLASLVVVVHLLRALVPSPLMVIPILTSALWSFSQLISHICLILPF